MALTRLSPEARRRRSAELREFLRTRRARITPADVGMPGGGARRTPGLRREEVAVLAGVGVSWYTWLEQGREINVSAEVLDAVARVLRMDDAERTHLYLLAGLNPPGSAAAIPSRGGEAVSEPLRRIIDGWMPHPAYIIDRHWRMIAVNRAARLALGYTEVGESCIHSFFTDPAFRTSLTHWEDAARNVAGQFRADAARYPDDPEFGRIADELCAQSPEFAAVWAEHPIGSAAEGVKALAHPVVGELVFEYSTLPLPDHPGARLLLHQPAPGTATAERVAGLLTADAPV